MVEFEKYEKKDENRCGITTDVILNVHNPSEIDRDFNAFRHKLWM